MHKARERRQQPLQKDIVHYRQRMFVANSTDEEIVQNRCNELVTPMTFVAKQRTKMSAEEHGSNRGCMIGSTELRVTGSTTLDACSGSACSQEQVAFVTASSFARRTSH